MSQTQDAWLFVDRDMSEPEMVPIAGSQACVFTARCPTKETANEDAAAVIPFSERAGVLVVADGCGGSAAGEQASRLALESLRDAIQQAAGTETLLRTAIINGIEQANLVIQELSIGAATTLAVIEVDGNTIRPYHVGDSAILVVGGRGKIKLQTMAHSPVGYGIQAGLLDEDEAMHHEDRHLVSNVIGTAEMHIEIGPPLRLAPRDTVVLASDGLFDNLQSDEIVTIIRKGKLTVSVGHLARDASERMAQFKMDRPCKPDDLTCIAFRAGL